jgi:hypothetical protein
MILQHSQTNSFDHGSGSLAVFRECERNVLGQQFVDPIDRVLGDALQYCVK